MPENYDYGGVYEGYDEEWYEDYPDYDDHDYAAGSTFKQIWYTYGMSWRWKLKITYMRLFWLIVSRWRTIKYKAQKVIFFIQTGKDLDKELPF